MKSGVSDWTSRPFYWWLLITVPAASSFAHSMAPTGVVFRGQGWGVLVGLTGGLAATALWFAYHAHKRASGLLSWFLVLTAAGWMYAVASIQVDDSLFNLTAFLVPLMLVLVWFKPPRAEDLLVSLQVIAYSIVLVSALSLILGFIGVGPNGFAVSDASPCRLWAACDLIGLLPGAEDSQIGVTRWGGPFGSVNIASPAGGLALIIGLLSQRWHRAILVFSGAVILILGQARLTLVAVAVTVIILMLLQRGLSATERHRTWRAYAAVATMLAVVMAVLIYDPTFSGRVGIWTGYLNLWATDIVFGVGDNGVRDYVLSRPGLLTYDHAHGVLMDAGVRYGLVLVSLLISMYVVACISAVLILRHGWAGPFAVFIFVVLAGSAETLYRAEYWTIYLAVLACIAAGSGAAAPVSIEKPPRDRVRGPQ